MCAGVHPYDYSAARRKLSLAEETSNLETDHEETTCRQGRKRKRVLYDDELPDIHEMDTTLKKKAQEPVSHKKTRTPQKKCSSVPLPGVPSFLMPTVALTCDESADKIAPGENQL